MNKKLSSLKRIVFGLKPFISPYKWEFAGAVLMVIISVVTMVSAPSVEGMITTQLASDLSLAESIGKLQVNFDEITKIMLMLAFIYLAKTLSQVFAVIWLTNAIQHAMQDLRNALQSKIRRLPVRYFDSHQFGDVLSESPTMWTQSAMPCSKALSMWLPGCSNHHSGTDHDVSHPCSYGHASPL